MNTKATTKRYRKTAIAVPAGVLDAVDRAARERGESRSKYITRVLELSVRARRDADVTRRLNELFADQELATSQRQEGEAFGALSGWDDERW